jgi:hypothetical protein
VLKHVMSVRVNLSSRLYEEYGKVMELGEEKNSVEVDPSLDVPSIGIDEILDRM